jgi:hypothetical protein
VCVVDIQPGSVGQDDVRRAEIVQLWIGLGDSGQAKVEAAGVPQRGLHLVVPSGALGSRHFSRRGVGQHNLSRGQDGVGGAVPGHRDAVLDLSSHDPAHSFEGTCLRGRWTDAPGWWTRSCRRSHRTHRATSRARLDIQAVLVALWVVVSQRAATHSLKSAKAFNAIAANRTASVGMVLGICFLLGSITRQCGHGS